MVRLTSKPGCEVRDAPNTVVAPGQIGSGPRPTQVKRWEGGKMCSTRNADVVKSEGGRI